jgi:hypothetical protein
MVRQGDDTGLVEPAERFTKLLLGKVETVGIAGERDALDRSLNVNADVDRPGPFFLIARQISEVAAPHVDAIAAEHKIIRIIGQPGGSQAKIEHERNIATECGLANPAVWFRP